MLVASFHFGPFDGRRLVLPTDTPWPRFVIPRWEDPVQIEAFYLLGGELDHGLWSYLWDDSYAGLAATNTD